MLLTSSQISVFISSSVVFTFTTLLFLSGYILQQQTVTSLRAAIHLHLPSPPSPTPTLNPVLAKHFGAPPGHSFYDKFLASNRPKGGWAKVAYVQLLRNHVEVCGAVVQMQALMESESMAQRIIMYPRAWDEKSTDGKKASAHIETSRRLLRKAAKEYKVMLQPIDPIAQLDNNTTASTTSTLEERYPLTSLLSLIHYNRILHFRPPGLILDPMPLDLLFSLPMIIPVLGLSAPGAETTDPAILLLQPSRNAYTEIMTSLPEGVFPDSEFLSRIALETAPTDPEFKTRLLAETGAIGEQSGIGKEGERFNSTEWMEGTAYVRLRDAELEGPEFDNSSESVKRARPDGEVGRAWEEVYERYREERMGVCGLDLEVVPKWEEVKELR